MSFYIPGSKSISNLSNGNVGINITNPNAKFCIENNNYYIGLSPTTSYSSVVLGLNAGRILDGSTTIHNVAIGQESLYNSTSNSVDNTVAIGYRAGYNNSFSGNVFIGSDAGYEGGEANVIIGAFANTNGLTNQSVVIGHNAGINNSGAYNTIIGSNAGQDNINGNNITLLGYNSEASVSNANDEITLGDANITTLRCATTTITSLSDARDKKDITSIDSVTPIIKDLRPVKFIWNMRNNPRKVDIPDYGFIAQELDDVQIKHNAEWLNLVYKANPERLEATYGKLLPILIKGWQEQQSLIENQEKQITELKTQLIDLTNTINNLITANNLQLV